MFCLWSCVFIMLIKVPYTVSCFLAQSTMTEPHHSFATVKAEALTRVGCMTGPAETANEEATQEALEVLDHGLGSKIQMEM